MKGLLLYIAAYFTLNIPVAGQNRLALPQIINYNSDQYKGGLQNWDIGQSATGVMYFGNNEGLLSFDGRYWKTHPLPNSTVVRSVAIDADERIYVGGQDEMGYFLADKQGILRYHSLIKLLPEQERQFADIWNIMIVEDGIFFRATSKIFHFKDGNIQVDKPEMEWIFLGKAEGKAYAQSRGNGLMRYDNGFWKPINNDKVLDDAIITAIIPYHQDTLLVTTLKNGLYYLTQNKLIPKKTMLQQLFENDRIYSALPVNEDWFVFGSTSAGALIMDREGRLIQQYVYGEGLQKNNVRKVFIDRNRNLWLALDDGIDFIAVNSAVKYINPNRSNPISSYAVNIIDNNLYIGTSNGLYVTKIDRSQEDISLSNADFREVENTKGQVWGLSEINGHMLMAHEDGAFVINGTAAQQLYGFPGTWTFQALSRVYPSSDIIAGTYLGLHHLTYTNGIFNDRGRIDGPYESLRFIQYENHPHTIWASHPYRGIFKLRLSPENNRVVQEKTYTAEEGLPSSLHNYLFLIKNKITAATKDGIYEYDPASDRFIPSAVFHEKFRCIELQYLNEDRNGNVWFINHKTLGVADFSRPTGEHPFSITYFPELNGKVLGGFESIYAYNDENIFIGANKGLIHLNYKRYQENISKPDILLSLVNVVDKDKHVQILFGGHPGTQTESPKLNYKSNSFHFAFSSTLYDQQDNIEYSYMLEGFDNLWSSWSHRSEKDYTNLPAGDYTFKVKSRNSTGNESSIVAYQFSIMPAWYKSVWSYIAYVFIVACVFYFFLRWQQKKLQQQHEHQLYLSQLELDRSEKEVVRLRNEKLESEISFKNKELANMTMHLIQRGEVLAKIKETILSVVKKHDFKDSTINFRQLIRLIRNVERTDEDWEQFSMHFNHVNEGFFVALKEKFPDLTPNELKLCAFIRLNLSSKEIAQLMNITIKGVEVGRYRLRKKLKLVPEKNLYEFLLHISDKTQEPKKQ